MAAPAKDKADQINTSCIHETQVVKEEDTLEIEKPVDKKSFESAAANLARSQDALFLPAVTYYNKRKYTYMYTPIIIFLPRELRVPLKKFIRACLARDIIQIPFERMEISYEELLGVHLLKIGGENPVDPVQFRLGDIFAINQWVWNEPKFRNKIMLWKACNVAGVHGYKIEVPSGVSEDVIVDVVSWLWKERSCSKALQIYSHADAFVIPPPMDLVALISSLPELNKKACQHFGEQGLEADVVQNFGAIRAYMTPDGSREFWPCQVPDEEYRNELFPRHWFLRYDVAQELERMGLLQNVFLFHGNQYQVENDMIVFHNADLIVKLGKMGTGKTHTTWQYIDWLKPENVLGLSTRIAQNEEMIRAAEKCGVRLTTYKGKEKQELIHVSKIMCTIQSLHQKLGEEWLIRHEDGLFLVIDEVQDMFTCLAQEMTVRERAKVLDCIKSAVMRAKVVVVMSADTRAWVVECILSWRRENHPNVLATIMNIEPANNSFQQKRDFVAYASSSDLTAAIMHDVGKDQAVVVASMSRTKVEELEDRAKQANIQSLAMTSFLGDVEWNELKSQNRNNQLKKIQWTLMQPAVGAGFSLDVQGHYKKVYLFANSRMPVDSHTQMVDRARNVNNDLAGRRVLHAHIPSTNGSRQYTGQRLDSTSRTAVKKKWTQAAEANQRREGTELEMENPHLENIKLYAESQKITDNEAFEARLFEEVKRAGYDLTRDAKVQRISIMEELSMKTEAEEWRVIRVEENIDTLYMMEVDKFSMPGALYGHLREMRRLGNQLNENEKRYVAMFEAIRRLGFDTINALDNDLALAVCPWGVRDLAQQIYCVRKYEEGRSPNRRTCRSMGTMSARVRDQTLRKLLEFLGFPNSRLHEEAKTYDSERSVTEEEYLFLEELCREYEFFFNAALKEEEVKRAKEEERNAVTRNAELPPVELCKCRVVKAFADVLLKNMGLKLEEASKNADIEEEAMEWDEISDENHEEDTPPPPNKRAKRAGRNKRPAIGMLRVRVKDLSFAYAVLASAPGIKEDFRERAQKYLARNPIKENAGQQRLLSKLNKLQQRLNNIQERVKKVYAYYFEEEAELLNVEQEESEENAAKNRDVDFQENTSSDDDEMEDESSEEEATTTEEIEE